MNEQQLTLISALMHKYAERAERAKDLARLARTQQVEVSVADRAKERMEAAGLALLEEVDRIADARVIDFAQCAVRASDVAEHVRHTLAQYEMLGLAAVGESIGTSYFVDQSSHAAPGK